MVKGIYKHVKYLKTQRDLIGVLFCLLLATLPYFILNNSKESVHILNSLAWLSAALLILRQRKIRFAVLKATEAIGLDLADNTLTQVISDFAKETSRYHRASFAFNSEKKGQKLIENLSKVAELAYHELPVQAVEMRLYEQQSGLGSNSLVVGVPSAHFNSHESLNNESQSIEVKGIRFINEPISFAGKKFGSLKVEIKKDYEFTKSDLQVLKLLAAQGGISLVDARFTEELLRLKRLSDETAQAKTGFLANLSHELRGPLGIILNGVELVSDGLCGEVNEQLAEMMRMVSESGNHLLDLVNDVLDYAKVEAGKVTSNPVVMPVKDLLEDLCSVVRTQAHAKQHKLILENVPNVFGVNVDKRHVRQMLINLLTNAIKYTQQGGEIKVWAEKSGNNIKIFVKDNGIGIAKIDHPKVFGAFERVNNQYALSQTGTGLGMPLTKKLAEVNLGSVDFESEIDQGSTFCLTLPGVEIAQPSVQNLSTLEIPQLNGKGETILLVDNNKDTREMIKLYLSKQGFNVVDVESGAGLFSVVKSHKIDLAIVENDLPDLTGEDLVVALRSMPQTVATPTILLSARAFVFDIERSLKIGVDICLAKPVSLSDLAIAVRKLLDASIRLEEKTMH